MTENEKYPIDDERRIRVGFIVRTATGNGNYSAGSIDIARLGDVKHALRVGDAVEIPSALTGMVRVRIELQGLPPDVAARAGVWTSKGQMTNGDECVLPMDEALKLFQSRRAIAVGDTPLARFFTACGRRPINTPYARAHGQ
jgi:hypothetical protein